MKDGRKKEASLDGLKADRRTRLLPRALALGAALACAAAARADAGLERGFVRIWKENGEKIRIPQAAERMPDGAWRYRLATKDIPRKAKWVDVVPDAAVTPRCDGYWVAGDNRYGRLDREAGTFQSARGHLQMPIFGLKTPDRCWVGVVKGLRLEFILNLAVARGVYHYYPRFEIDRIEFDPYEDIVVDYYELAGGDADYAGMAKVYRNWNLQRGWVKPLKERVKGNPALAWSAKSVFMRCKLSHCDGHCRDNPARAMPPILWKRTFADYKKLMKQVKDLGMDDVDMCIVGWNYLGFDGPFPKLWPVPEELGGEAGMKDAIAYGKSLGYRMSVHVNNHNIYRACGRPRWNEDDICVNAKGHLRTYGYLQGGLAYHTCFQVVNNRWLDEDLAHLKAMGLDGIHHVDVTSARYPTPCHAPNHPANRKEMAAWQLRTCEKVRAAFGGYSSEAGMDHLAPGLDSALYVGTFASKQQPATALVDGEVPLWQVAYNGIILSQPYWATVDASYGRGGDPLKKTVDPAKRRDIHEMTGMNEYLWDAAHRTLKVWEYGGRPTFYFQNYETLAPMKEMYDAWQPMKHLVYEFIDRHDRLAENVFRTRWENGEEVVVNYSDDTPYRYRGRAVRPLGYAFYAK